MSDLEALTAALDERLADADAALAAGFPGPSATRQPVHTVYVPADRFHAGTVAVYGAAALAALDAHEALFREVTGADDDLVARVRAKLEREPVEDVRVDFEDGYAGTSETEDADVARTAPALAATRTLRRGIRFKSLERLTRARGVATLATFVGGLVAAGDDLTGFVVTLPKVTSVDQVEAMVEACTWLERDHALAAGTLRFEIQVETPQSILGPDGTALVARMLHAADGRCAGLHYGTYDYSAFCGIAAAHQSMEHPVADHAKAVMQAAAAGTGVPLSDGSTNVLPVGDEDAVRAGWALHHRLVTRSLERGYYQGWDLHPAQLPTRYAATYRFYRDGFPAAAARLRVLAGDEEGSVMDEPATYRALADFALRGLDCAALSVEEVREATRLEPGRLSVLARRVPGDA